MRDLALEANFDVEASVQRIAAETENYSGADLAGLCDRAKRLALRQVGFSDKAALADTHLLQACEEGQRLSD